MPARPRILIVLAPSLDPSTGGVQMSTVRLARMLNTQGNEVGVFSYADTGHQPNAHVRLFAAPSPGNVSNPTNHTALANAITRFDPAIVINQMPYEHAITETLKHAFAGPRIGCLHNTLYSVRNNLDAYIGQIVPRRVQPLVRNPLGKALLLALHRRRHEADLRRILADYDRFVMFAQPNLEELRYFVPDYDPASIALIPNSIPDVAAEVPAKEKSILWLARVAQHQKRADLILPLWRLLVDRLPDWRLDVVGDGPLLPELRAQAKAEGLPRIQFHGRQPSQPFFERAAVYVMTSEFEGFPNTLIEAQSRGAVPVVFDSYPMARWLVTDGEDGILSPTRDVATLAQNIAGLCQMPERRKAMSGAALASAARFTEQEVAGQWGALIDTVLEERLSS
jgi:glycosyltransferase involved in cell wall biosynthesis